MMHVLQGIMVYFEEENDTIMKVWDEGGIASKYSGRGELASLDRRATT